MFVYLVKVELHLMLLLSIFLKQNDVLKLVKPIVDIMVEDFLQFSGIYSQGFKWLVGVREGDFLGNVVIKKFIIANKRSLIRIVQINFCVI